MLPKKRADMESAPTVEAESVRITERSGVTLVPKFSELLIHRKRSPSLAAARSRSRSDITP